MDILSSTSIYDYGYILLKIYVQRTNLWTYAQYYSWCMDSVQFLHAAAVQSDPEGFIFIFIFQKGH